MEGAIESQDNYFVVQSKDHYYIVSAEDLLCDDATVKIGSSVKFTYGSSKNTYVGEILCSGDYDEMNSKCKEIRKANDRKPKRDASFHVDRPRRAAVKQQERMMTLMRGKSGSSQKAVRKQDSKKAIVEKNKTAAAQVAESAIQSDEESMETLENIKQLPAKHEVQNTKAAAINDDSQSEEDSQANDSEDSDSSATELSKDEQTSDSDDVVMKPGSGSDSDVSVDKSASISESSVKKHERKKGSSADCLALKQLRKQESRNFIFSKSEVLKNGSSKISGKVNALPCKSSDDEPVVKKGKLSQGEVKLADIIKEKAAKKFDKKGNERKRQDLKKSETREQKMEKDIDVRNEDQGDEENKVNKEQEEQPSLVEDFASGSHKSADGSEPKVLNNHEQVNTDTMRSRAGRNMTIYQGQNYRYNKHDNNVVKVFEKYDVYVDALELEDALKRKSTTGIVRSLVEVVYTRDAILNATVSGFPPRGKGRAHYAGGLNDVPPRFHPHGVKAIMEAARAVESSNKAWRPKASDKDLTNAMSARCCELKKRYQPF